MEVICQWCLKKMKTSPKEKAGRLYIYYCSYGCRDAEHLFRVLFSDEFYRKGVHNASEDRPTPPTPQE